MTQNNITDPTLTLLEERFLSSGYRKDMLEDKLHSEKLPCYGGGWNLGHFVATIRSLPTKREWCSGEVHKRMRIEFDITSAPRYEHFIEHYLLAFYATITKVHDECRPQSIVIFFVDISPQDTEWLRIVSNRARY